MKWVIGSDEAGYGTWAGSLVVAACALPEDWEDSSVTDSKKLSHEARVAAVQRHRKDVPWAVQQVTAEQVDEHGVWDRVIWAHAAVHNKLRVQLLDKGVESDQIEHVIDGLQTRAARKKFEALMLTKDFITMPRADESVPAVSLASCFAKTGQCMLMDKLHEQYPDFGFGNHRGYGTPQHKEALIKHGPIKGVHRFSYSSIKKLAT